MYNSILVNLLVKLWQKIEALYEYSLVSKIFRGLGRGCKSLIAGSFIMSLFCKNSKAMEKTILYRIYGGLIDLYNRLFNSLNKFIKNAKKTSILSKNTSYIIESKLNLFKVYGVILASFVLGVLFLGMRFGHEISLLKIIMTLGIVGLSLLFLKYGKEIFSYVEDSKLCNLIKGLFEIDEGVDQWW